MAEFEFKMLGFAYQLDQGGTPGLISRIRRLHQQFRSRQGLTRSPFNDKRKELEFYLALQNPRTGAFMDGPPFRTAPTIRPRKTCWSTWRPWRKRPGSRSA